MGWMGGWSLGGVKYRAAYTANNRFTDVVDVLHGRDGMGLRVR